VNIFLACVILRILYNNTTFNMCDQVLLALSEQTEGTKLYQSTTAVTAK